jgi:subtilisin
MASIVPDKVLVIIIILMTIIYGTNLSSSDGLLTIIKAQEELKTGKVPVSVIIGFQPGMYNPDIIIQAGGRITTEYYPLIEALAAEVPGISIQNLEKNSAIKYVERNKFVYLQGHDGSNSPNTLEYKDSWGVDHIDADQVHYFDILTQRNLNGVKVCVIDSGVDYNHPQLRLSYRGGHDFVDDDTDPMDSDVNSHGTRVAGIIVAMADQNDVVGVAPPIFSFYFPFFKTPVSMYAVRVLHTGGGFQIDDVLSGIKWCVDNGTNIISMSLAADLGPFATLEMVRAAHNKGILLIAGSGNQGTRDVSCPACWDEVIAVGAIDEQDRRWASSSFGNALDLMAPGVDIKSTTRTDLPFGFRESGTSYATPHVTGVAALIWAHMPNPTRDKVVQRLIETAIDLGVPEKDEEFGFGLVNADSAVMAFAETFLFMDPVVDITPGSDITVSGELWSAHRPPNPNSNIGTYCSSPCYRLPDRDIVFTGIGTVPLSVRTDTRGIFTATFKAPDSLGEWKIKAEFIGDSVYLPSHGPVLTYRTILR